MPNKRPLILVTGPDKGGDLAWMFTATLIWALGGKPKRMQPRKPQVPNEFAGVVIGGGADIHPSRYREALLPELRLEMKRTREGAISFIWAAIIWCLRRLFSVDRRKIGHDENRDALEWTVLEAAVQMRVPVLGLCRGAQLINVFFEGSLHQSIQGFYKEKPNLHTIRARKLIELDMNSKLGKAIGKRRTRVNSLHKQAVNRLGNNMKVTAWEANGVVQAVEHETLPFVVGVQWHPEFLPFVKSQRRIFKCFLASAKAKLS